VTFVTNREAERGLQRGGFRHQRAARSICFVTVVLRRATRISACATRSWTTADRFGLSVRPAAAGPAQSGHRSVSRTVTSTPAGSRRSNHRSTPCRGSNQIGGVLQELPGQQILASELPGRRGERDAGPRASGGREYVARGAAHQAGHVVHCRADAVDLRVGKNFKLRGSQKLQVMPTSSTVQLERGVGATSNAGEPPAAINTTYGPHG